MKGLTLSRAHLHFAFSNLHFAFFVLHFEFKLPAKNSEFFCFKYPWVGCPKLKKRCEHQLYRVTPKMAHFLKDTKRGAKR